MSHSIRKVAVLGSGVMGSAIAAHLAGCGYPVVMLDIVPFDSMLSDKEKAKKDTKEVRNKLGTEALAAALKAKIPAFYTAKAANIIEIGNFDDDFAKIGDADWIIEVVVERMDIKKQILAKVDQFRKKGSIVSTNTSGLSVAGMSEDCSGEMKEHFLGTHFFNPVRFMKLLEIIPGPKTKPDVLNFMAAFCQNELGKGIVWCKDTPNFIANRIGVYGICGVMHAMVEEGLTIPEVDAIVGEPMGRPKTAAFKTSDMVGLDTLGHVAKTVYDNCVNDEERAVFQVPDFFNKMIESKRLGDKTKGGFYKKDGKDRFVVDHKTMEYVAAGKPEFDSIKNAKGEKGLGNRMKFLVNADDKAGKFAWKLMSRGLLYSARRIPEISDSVVEIDNAMQWGFNWKMGPFRTWDAIGVEESVARMKAEGLEVPALVEKMLATGAKTFYKKEGDTEYAYDLLAGKYVAIKKDPMFMILAETGGTKKVAGNDGASIWDIGDGVCCLEFHTKMNAIDNDIIEMQAAMCDMLDDGKFEAAVVFNHAENFSVGGNLFMMLMAHNNNMLGEVEKTLQNLQKAQMRMKYNRRPVVVAPGGLTLGGGCEVALHGQKVVGAAETYIGLVEVGVGLIPAGGGTKEFAMRVVEGIPAGAKVPMLPFAQKAFENIAMAKVAVGIKQAMDFGILRETDIMVPNRDLLLYRAKETALGMAKVGWNPGQPRTDIPVAGENTYAAFLIALDGMKKSGWISEHDVKVSSKVGYIVSGGKRAEGQTVSEWELLDWEIEAFMSLLGEPKTIERIQYMLMNNKPLRN